MQRHAIRVRGKRRFVLTAHSNHADPLTPNLPNRQFDVAVPDWVWAGDTSYIAIDEGWLYPAVVIDPCSDR